MTGAKSKRLSAAKQKAIRDLDELAARKIERGEMYASEYGHLEFLKSLIRGDNYDGPGDLHREWLEELSERSKR